MSTRDDRSRVEKIKHKLEGFGGAERAAALIGDLLAIPAPRGHADGVAELAGQFKSSANNLNEIQLAVYKVGTNIPHAWVGVASNEAANVIRAIYTETDRSVHDLISAQGVLNKLADAFADARTTYDHAQDPLHTARSAAAAGELVRARDLAIEGATQLLGALDTVLSASNDAARDLRTLTANARAAQLSTGSLTSADKLMLASASDKDPINPTWILTETEVERAATQLDGLSDTDRLRFVQLLSFAKSPQEQAYLMKALATGDGMAVVGAFAEQIHPHGNDPTWLRNHLTPAQLPQSTPQHGTAALDVIHARAAIDPNYALYLTAGGNSNDPNGSSMNAMTDRLAAEQHRVGSEPDHTLEQTWEVGNPNGTTYRHHQTGADERAALVHDVENATDQGKTVFVHTHDGHNGMIVGHAGDALQVHDLTSGNTTWITEGNFADGLLPGASEPIESVDVPS